MTAATSSAFPRKRLQLIHFGPNSALGRGVGPVRVRLVAAIHRPLVCPSAVLLTEEAYLWTAKVQKPPDRVARVPAWPPQPRKRCFFLRQRREEPFHGGVRGDGWHVL